MKLRFIPQSHLRHARALSLSSGLLLAGQASAQLYWDSNASSTGFGNTTGTWGSSNFWNTSSTGGTGTFSTTTSSTDTVNFGTASTNYGNASVGIASGGVTVNSITYGAGQSTAINLGTAGNSITLAGTTPTITVNRAGVGTPQTISSPLVGSAGLTKSGNGLLVLSGSNSYSGGTNINAGLVRFTSGSAMSSSGGTIAVGTGGGLIVDVGATGGRFTSATSGAGSFGGILAGVGTGGNAITYSGAVTVGVDLSASGTAFTYSGVIANPSGSTSLSLFKLNGQNLILTGANTYSGKTIIHGGSIVVTSIGNIGDASSPLGTNSTIDFLGSGNLTFTGTTAQSSNKILNIAEGGATLRADGTGAGAIDFTADINPTSTSNKTLSLFGGNTNANTISGDISNGAGGTLSIAKNLTGRWVLSGANTYTGSTTVTAGTLLIHGSTASASTVSVASGATLGGTGTIGGAVNVTGILSPGASIETLGTGTLSFANGSTLVQEIDSSAATSAGSDLLKVTGDLNLTGNVGLNLTDIAVTDVPFTVGTVFSLINYTGTWNGGLFTLSGNELADEEEFTLGLNTWRISYNDATGGLNYSGEFAGGSDSFVNLTAVPEPRAILLGGLGMLVLLRRRR